MQHLSSSPAPQRTKVSYLLQLVLAVLISVPAAAQQPITIDARRPVAAPEPVQATLGTGTRPDGQTLTVNSQYLVLNGKPWLPVMGSSTTAAFRARSGRPRSSR